MEPISDEEVVKSLPALAEAARASSETAGRFVAPRTGILEEVAARHHQFVFGRRGVGKSTLLRKIESLGPEAHGDVIFVDIETLRGRPYPDVLIELLIEILDKLQERLRQKGGRFDFDRGRRRARRNIVRLANTMRRLLEQPQVAERVISELKSSNKGLGVWFGGEFKFSRLGRAGARAGAGRKANRQETREARVEESKMEGLLSAVVLI